VKALATVAGVAYPFVVYLGLQLGSPRALAALLAAVVMARLALHPRQLSWALLSPFAVAGALVLGVIGAAALLDDARFFRLVPVLVNLGLFVAFARSLARGTPIVEAVARLHRGALPPEAVSYCRRLTVLWSVFFVANAAFITFLSVAASLEVWTLYTGLLSYLVVGLLMAAEAVFRAWRYRRYDDGLAALVLRRVFPPPPAG
jgi:uncharacterized membrane protein